MEYADFKNKHFGQKIIIVGCGVSAKNLTNPQDYITIGVNDLSRLFTPNYLVVLNEKSSFEEDRWKWIESSTCPHVFTQFKNLEIKEENKVVLKIGRYRGIDIGGETVDHTSNSTYVSCIIAAYMGAKKIGLIGVDFTPNHFFAQTGEHGLSKRIDETNSEYKLLRQAMNEKGIELVNLSEISKITTLPKEILYEF
jgi:hypothetical protein